MLPIEICVPQGKILGVLLFIVYINDIFELISEDNLIVSYADDTVLVSYDVTRSMVLKKLQRLLNKVNAWLIENALSLNVDKTVRVTFGNYIDSIPTNLEIHRYFIENDVLKRVNQVKY